MSPKDARRRLEFAASGRPCGNGLQRNPSASDPASEPAASFRAASSAPPRKGTSSAAPEAPSTPGTPSSRNGQRRHPPCEARWTPPLDASVTDLAGHVDLWPVCRLDGLAGAKRRAWLPRDHRSVSEGFYVWIRSLAYVPFRHWVLIPRRVSAALSVQFWAEARLFPEAL
jgi:hypothetical protein